MASVAKIAAIFILFGVTFLLGLLPLALLKLFEKKLTSKSRIKKWIGLLNCFSGGVFFGTALLHLLPETVELIEESISFDYPIAEALAGAGFFLILFLENLIGACGYGHSHHMHDIGHENPAAQTCVEDKRGEQTSAFNSKTCEGNVFEQNGLCAMSSQLKTPDCEKQSKSIDSKTGEKIKLEQNGECSTSIGYGTISKDDSNKEENNGIHNNTPREEIEVIRPEVEEPEVVIETNNPEFLAFRSVVLLFALSFHMIFEGLSVGLQKTDEDTWRILGVLALHKCIVAFSVGLQLAEGFRRLRNIFISLSLLAVVAPIVVVIGYVVTETGEDSRSENIAAGVLQGISIGSFLYVTFFEILNRELDKGRNLWKVLSTVLGFGVVVGLLFLSDGHGHGHEHEGENGEV